LHISLRSSCWPALSDRQSAGPIRSITGRDKWREHRRSLWKWNWRHL